MGIFDIFRSSKQAARSDPIDTIDQSVDPLVITPVNIIGGRLADQKDLRLQNRYALADSLYNYDERLYSAIELMALMIEKSIGDISIAGIRQDDNELTNEEKNAVKVANDFAKKIDLRRLFYHYTLDLWKYGDAVDLIKFSSKGVEELEPLPMQSITAVDRRDQVNKAIGFNESMIRKPKYYVVDERLTDPNVPDQVIKKERILHISFNPRRNQIRDNFGRWTINTWSVAPIASLIAILQWKQILIRNNILWSNRAVPREHHQLDLSKYDLTKFAGSFEQKETASIAAGKAAIVSYNESLQRREADQGFVTGKGVEIKYIEPKMQAHNAMPIIDQINASIGGPAGIPAALLGGESKGFTSLVHSTSMLALRAEKYAGVIQRPLEELIKRHIGIARPGIRKSVVDRLYIKNRLILDRDRTELAKIIAVLVESKSFTMDELRIIWGFDPMTEKQAKDHIAWLKKIQKLSSSSNEGGKRSEDLLRENPSSPTKGQESQGKRSRDLIQKGDDKGRKQ